LALGDAKKKFPDKMKRAHPRLCLIYVGNFGLTRLRNEAKPYGLNAQQALSQNSKLVEEIDNTSAFNALHAETAAFRSLITTRCYDNGSAIKYISQAVKTAPSNDFYI
jgi:hypothetical protein